MRAPRTILARLALGIGLAIGIMCPAVLGWWWDDAELLGAGLLAALVSVIVLFVVFWQEWQRQKDDEHP